MAVVDLQSLLDARQRLVTRRTQLDRRRRQIWRRLIRAQDKQQRLLANDGYTEPERHHDVAAKFLLIVAVILLPIVAYFYIQAIGGLITARMPDYDGHFEVIAFLASSPVNSVLAAGCAAFIAAAKILDVVYCKLLYPKWLFLIVASIALVLVFGNAAILAKVAADNGKIADIGIAIEKVEHEVRRILLRATRDDAPVAACSGADREVPDCAEVTGLIRHREVLQGNANLVKTEGIQAIEFSWRLIALLSEIFIAGFAFCVVSDINAHRHLRRVRVAQVAVIAGLTCELASTEKAQTEVNTEIANLTAAVTQPN
jgi:hypothetical protein